MTASQKVEQRSLLLMSLLCEQAEFAKIQENIRVLTRSFGRAWHPGVLSADRMTCIC
jgi:hypothetical protein